MLAKFCKFVNQESIYIFFPSKVQHQQLLGRKPTKLLIYFCNQDLFLYIIPFKDKINEINQHQRCRNLYCIFKYRLQLFRPIVFKCWPVRKFSLVLDKKTRNIQQVVNKSRPIEFKGLQFVNYDLPYLFILKDSDDRWQIFLMSSIC